MSDPKSGFGYEIPEIVFALYVNDSVAQRKKTGESEGNNSQGDKDPVNCF